MIRNGTLQSIMLTFLIVVYDWVDVSVGGVRQPPR